ncbi:MAG TPA: STT3 domain-containing protein [Candidatus Nanoarchaeia archaeon]|nr:STT3 domain-containing protein [Candidatus Nanoarchaeia archaeon]
MSEHWTWWEFACLAAILILGLTFLLQPRFLVRLDDLAAQDIEREVRARTHNELIFKNPTLPDAEIDRLVEEHMQELDNQDEIARLIRDREAEYHEAYSDADGIPYLTHVDPYLYVRYARDIVQTGSYGIVAPNSRSDPLRNAPGSEVIRLNPLPFFLAYFFEGVHMIFPVTLTSATALYPPIFGLILIFVCYLFLRQIGGVRAAQFSMLALATHAQFFAAFQWGYVDTNAFNVLCGALLLIFAYVAVVQHTWRWRMFAMAAATGLFTLFSAVWAGAVFFGALATAAFLLMGTARVWPHPKLAKYRALLMIAVSIVLALGGILIMRQEIWSRIKLYLGGGVSGSLPNPFPYVGEFKALSFGQWLSAIGGPIVFMVMVVGLIVVFQRIIRSRGSHSGSILLLLWFAAMVFPSTRLRFLQFAIVPLVALLGLGAAWCWKQGAALASHWAPRGAPLVASFSLIMLILISTIPGTFAAVQNANPVMNDAIERVAMNIRQQSPPDAIVATWWNNGYLYQYFAERGTYFDGASFDDTKAYWISRYLMETDRQIARNILRAMSCDGYALSGLVAVYPKNTTENVNRFLQMNRERAEQTLRRDLGNASFKPLDPNLDNFMPGKGQMLFSDLWCEVPRETSVVVSEDLLSLLWAFDWYTKVDFEHPNSRISGRSELNAVTFGCNTIETNIICEQGISADLQQGKAHDALGRTMPFFFVDGKTLHRPQEDVPPNVPMVIFFVDHDRLRAALVNSDLLNTMFVRLFFFGGADMPEYAWVADASGKYEPRTIAYRVDWDAEIV